MSLTLFESAARTASANSIPVTRRDYRGVHIIIDATAKTATPSVVFTIQGYDPVNDTWYDLLVSAAITGVSNTLLSLYPGLAATANVSISQVLPEKWRVEAVAADGDSLTYSVIANPLV